ncbi:ankyrin, partial [Lepidopterella palustris CBS 459.81]
LQAASAGGHEAVVKLLVGKGADVNAQGRETHSCTALHLAARGGHIDTFQYLVNIGLDLSTLDAKGDGILCYASSGGSLGVLKATLNHDLTPPSKSMHWSPLHWACRSGNPEVVELLIKEGLRSECVTICEPLGQWSPLDIANFHGHEEMVGNLSSSCRALLGSETDTTRSPGKRHNGYQCDGCFHVSG